MTSTAERAEAKAIRKQLKVVKQVVLKPLINRLQEICEHVYDLDAEKCIRCGKLA